MIFVFYINIVFTMTLIAIASLRYLFIHIPLFDTFILSLKLLLFNEYLDLYFFLLLIALHHSNTNSLTLKLAYLLHLVHICLKPIRPSVIFG